MLPKARAVSPNIPYSINEFMADQRRLLSMTRFRSTDYPETVDLLDGRLVVVHPSLRQVPSVPDLRGPFVNKYGAIAEPSYRRRFILVLKFLATWQSELVKHALAHGSEPLAVREEFVGFLLNYKLHKQQSEIPQEATRRFLDEWSHRWL